jgi:integrase
MIVVRLCSNGEYWQARWVLPGGRRVTRGIGPKSEYSRRAAEIECAKIQREVENSTNVRLGNKSPRLSEFLERYLAARTDLAEKSLAIQDLVIRRLKLFFSHDPRMDAVTTAHANDFKQWCVTHKFGDSEYKLSNSTVFRHIVVARQIFGVALDEDLIGKNPFAKVKAPAVVVDKDWEYIDDATLAQILDACPNEPMRMLFRLARWAGLRQQEAVKLGWDRVDWDRRQLTVMPPEGKRTTKAKQRTTPIQAKLYDALLAWFEGCPKGTPGPCSGVPDNNLYRQVDGILKRAGVPRYADPFHTLRRNLASDWVEVYPLLDVASWTGHSPQVLATFYHKTKAEMVQKVTGTNLAQSKGEKVENPNVPGQI